MSSLSSQSATWVRPRSVRLASGDGRVPSLVGDRGLFQRLAFTSVGNMPEYPHEGSQRDLPVARHVLARVGKRAHALDFKRVI